MTQYTRYGKIDFPIFVIYLLIYLHLCQCFFYPLARILDKVFHRRSSFLAGGRLIYSHPHQSSDSGDFPMRVHICGLLCDGGNTLDQFRHFFYMCSGAPLQRPRSGVMHCGTVTINRVYLFNTSYCGWNKMRIYIKFFIVSYILRIN